MGETVEAAETADRVKPWTIKGIPPEERNAAIAAADREGLTIGEWLTRAIRTQVQADHRSDRLPVALDPPLPSKVDRQAMPSMRALSLIEAKGGYCCWLIAVALAMTFRKAAFNPSSSGTNLCISSRKRTPSTFCTVAQRAAKSAGRVEAACSPACRRSCARATTLLSSRPDPAARRMSTPASRWSSTLDQPAPSRIRELARLKWLLPTSSGMPII